ncbi:MAG: hypothetical protein ABIP39_07745 [Polyangiaceae bacterium]
MRFLSTVVVSVATASLFAMPLACSSSSDSSATPDAGSPEGSVPVDAGPQMDTTVPASTLTLTVTTAPAPLTLGKSVHLIVHVGRGAADTGNVVVTITGLPSGVTASPTTIAAGASDGDIALTASMTAKIGSAMLSINAAAPTGSASATAKLTVRGLSGTLDTGLAGTGVFFATTATEGLGSIVVQPDGKIIVGGHSTLAAWVARYDDAMTPDMSFGTTGSTSVDFSTGFREDLYSLLPDASGRIVAVGTSNTTGVTALAIAARFTAAGALDPTYGTAGKTTMAYVAGNGAAAPRSLMQADGKVTLLGNVTNGLGQWAFARLTSDGAVDASFGTSGVTAVPTAQISGAPACGGFQSDGKLVAGGVDFGVGGPIVPIWRVERLLALGALDDGFGTSGGFSVPQSAVSGIAGCAVNPVTNTFVAAGVILEDPHYDFALERFTSAGVVDPTFNGGAVSKIIISDSDGTAQLGVTDVFLTTDGKIVAVGSAPSGFFTIARWNADGTPDTTFGTAGVFSSSGPVTSQGQIIATAYDAAQNRILFAGTGVVGGSTGIFVSRVWL